MLLLFRAEVRGSSRLFVATSRPRAAAPTGLSEASSRALMFAWLVSSNIIPSTKLRIVAGSGWALAARHRLDLVDDLRVRAGADLGERIRQGLLGAGIQEGFGGLDLLGIRGRGHPFRSASSALGWAASAFLASAASGFVAAAAAWPAAGVGAALAAGL